MKLALGTVQFGLNYGIANAGGKLKVDEIKKILEIARRNNIDTLDTAISYGNAETILGNIGVNEFKISTKLSPDSSNLQKDTIIRHVYESLERLSINRIHTVFFHRVSDLIHERGSYVYEILKELKSQKIISKIGISIYSPKELDLILDNYDLDIIQTPFNLIDRNIEKLGYFSKLKKRNIEVHVRSIFLQGLLLMKYEKIPDKFRRWDYIWQKWNNWQSKNPSISAVDTCLNYVYKNSNIDKVVVGVDNSKQLKQIINSVANFSDLKFPDISSDDEDLIYPFNWQNL